jgi:enoyl-CoA hydratase/carnithine racemase
MTVRNLKLGGFDKSNKLNSLGAAVRTDLLTQFKEAEKDPEVTVIAIHGANGNFSAGKLLN